MNVIIPMAGSNGRAADTEYVRGLQEVERKTVLQHAFESLQDVEADRFVAVVKREDADAFHIDDVVRLLRPGADVVVAGGRTMGAACTCMLAVDRIEMDEPLLIVGSDQLLTVSAAGIIGEFEEGGYDGGVVIFDDVHPRWSYVRVDGDGLVVEAAEKRPISRNAVAGFYYFRKASFFMEAARRMILKGASVNGSFYVCPAYNEMVLQQMAIGTRRIEKDQYYSMSHDSGMEAYRAYLREKREETEGGAFAR